jgi:hypothetical protein
MEPIKLGRKPEMPSMPGPSSTETSMEEYFPTLHLEWDKSYNLPDGEFTMTVKARRVRSTKDEKSKKVNEDVEILEIQSVKGSKKKKDSHDEAADALDKLKEESDETAPDQESDEY